MDRRFLALLLSATTAWTMAQTMAAAEDWPRFRGPDGNGISPAVGLPLRWSETQNVRWKVAIPGQRDFPPSPVATRDSGLPRECVMEESAWHVDIPVTGGQTKNIRRLKTA